MKSKTSQLSAENLKDAGIKSFENASELVQEARILYEHKCWSRAVFLCFISGEELGKCFITLSAVVNQRREDSTRNDTENGFAVTQRKPDR